MKTIITLLIGLGIFGFAHLNAQEGKLFLSAELAKQDYSIPHKFLNGINGRNTELSLNNVLDVELGIEYHLSSNFYIGTEIEFGYDQFIGEVYNTQSENTRRAIGLYSNNNEQLNYLARLGISGKLGYEYSWNKWSIRSDIELIGWKFINSLEPSYSANITDEADLTFRSFSSVSIIPNSIYYSIQGTLGVTRALWSDRISLIAGISYRHRLNDVMMASIESSYSPAGTVTTSSTGQLLTSSLIGRIGIRYRLKT